MDKNNKKLPRVCMYDGHKANTLETHSKHMHDFAVFTDTVKNSNFKN